MKGVPRPFSKFKACNFSRPYGTSIGDLAYPALKRWAIGGGPFGTGSHLLIERDDAVVLAATKSCSFPRSNEPDTAGDTELELQHEFGSAL